MSKAKKYAAVGGISGGLIKAVLNTIKQMDQIKADRTLKFNWRELFLETGKGMLIAGAGGLVIGAIKDHQNSQVKPINTDPFLYALVRKLQLDKNDKIYLLLNEKADQLIELIKKEFHSELFNDPIKIGSTQKGTALIGKYDIDISVPFRTDGFSSTTDMYYSISEFFRKKIGSYSIVDVRDQKKSIGVFVKIQSKEYKVDIVPNRITRKRGNKTSGYLHVNKSSFFSDNSTYQKTNIHLLNRVKLTLTQKRIIVILKLWKTKNELPLSSHLLESLVLDAYRYNAGGIPKSFTKKLIMVLKHISENLDIANIRSIENTNNILTNISEESKRKIISACIAAVEDYDYHPNSAIDIFKNS